MSRWLSGAGDREGGTTLRKHDVMENQNSEQEHKDMDRVSKQKNNEQILIKEQRRNETAKKCNKIERETSKKRRTHSSHKEKETKKPRFDDKTE